AALAREIGAGVLSTDRIRQEGRRRPGFSKSEKGGVYERMFERADQGLRAGRNVILDATFYLASLRAQARAVARRAGACAFVVEVVSPERVVRERMARRLRDAKNGYRPAGYAVHGYFLKSYEPVRGRHYFLDTADSRAWRRDLLFVANALRIVERDRAIIGPLLRSRPMKLLQTHISWVLLDGRRAYKIKKPVRFSFVDYRSPELRREFCRKEVQVNARLSPGLYLGIVPVRDDAGAVSFGGPGRTVDHAVEMLEMPQDARLDRLVAKDAVGPDEIAAIVRTLCDFHGRARVVHRGAGSPEAIRAGFSHAFRLKPLIEKEFSAGPALGRIVGRVDGFLRANQGLFRERVRRGRIRHGHGDLRMSNIFLAAGQVRIFDAIEFNPALAVGDVAADVGYLAMDLFYCGRRDLAERFIGSYIDCSGDEGLRAVADLYMCYRALVRLLVESLFLVDPTIGAGRKKRARQASLRYLALADAFSRRL
ncbi:MAG TPA: AAA family ATPase, partial [Acidobacteriota bacterium]|nr:AAA family ATPase [Acidobacteriota bacterium]